MAPIIIGGTTLENRGSPMDFRAVCFVVEIE